MWKNYYIYLNLHSKDPKTFSVLQNGKVVASIQALKVLGSFKVRQGGYKQAVAEDVKNVHAFVVTDAIETSETLIKSLCRTHSGIQSPNSRYKNQWIEVSYNHRKSDSFYVKTIKGDYPIKSESYKFNILLCDHKCYIPTDEFIKYLITHDYLHFLEAYEYVFKAITPMLQIAVKYLIHNVEIYRKNPINVNPAGVFKPQAAICGNLVDYIITLFDFKDIDDKPINSLKLSENLIIDLINKLVSEVAKNHWKYYSGNEKYPIAISEKPYLDYATTQDKWLNSNYADLRVDLLLTIDKYLGENP